MSKNFNGLCDPRKRDTVFRKVVLENKRDPIAALMIQEHGWHTKVAETAKREAKSYRLLLIATTIPAAETKGGTGIIIPYDSIELQKDETLHQAITRIENSATGTRGGRTTTLSILQNKKKLRVTSAYAHSDAHAAQRPAFFSQELGNTLTRNTILGIDANTVPDESLDLKRVGNAPYNNTGANELANEISKHNLVDVARESLGKEPLFTSHHNVAGGVTHTRIDQIYAPDLNGLIWHHDSTTHDPFLTKDNAKELDHTAIAIYLENAEGDRGNDLIKINEAIYDNSTFLREIVDLIEFTVESAKPEANKCWNETWTQLKKQILHLSKKETKRTTYKDNKQTKQLKQKRDSLKQAIDNGTANASDITEYIRLQAEIGETTRTERALYETIEEVAYRMGKTHDVGSAAMYRPYKPKGSAQWINDTFEADWTNTSNPKKTGARCKDAARQAHAATPYWKRLFTRRKLEPDSAEACYKTLRKGNRVQPPTAKRCGEEITAKEVIDVCNTLPTAKSPGPDRLPNKLYKNLSAVVGPIIANVANESRTRGAYPEGFSAGLISLLYKKGERDDPRNYRPITLLNGDYKIVMRTLTRRMNESVVQFVSEFQSGFVPDAFLAENIMLLKQAQAYAESEDEEIYFLFLDMEKAFDRCSWEFLVKAMKEIGYDDGFINYVKLAYNHDTPPTRQLVVNGYLGPTFPLESGVAQGCPLSPLLFLLITEPLSRLIVNDKQNIKGLTIGKLRLVISQFADDTTLILRDADTTPAQNHIETWCKATTMAENHAKREGMLIGKWNNDRARAPRGVLKDDAWLQDGKTIRALGAPMGNNVDETAWYHGRYRTVKNRIANWPSLRRHSITGRNMLLQAILYGSFRFWMFFMIMPESVATLIEQDAKQILWSTDPLLESDAKGSERCRRWIHEKASYLGMKRGGAGIMHWLSHCEAFYAQWMIRYLHPRRAPWKEILDHWLHGHIGRAILVANVDREDILDKIPPGATYIRRCLSAFLSLKVTQNLDLLDETVQAEPAWYNHRFSIKVRKDSFKFLTETLNVHHVSDVLDKNSKPFSDDEWNRLLDATRPPTHYPEWKNPYLNDIDKVEVATARIARKARPLRYRTRSAG